MKRKRPTPAPRQRATLIQQHPTLTIHNEIFSRGKGPSDEMTEKIFLDDQNRATFKCPKCSKSWTKDLSGFKNSNKRIQLKCKCPCGHAFPVIQERRNGFRRTVTVTGAYFHNQREIRGLITVKNISKSGAGLILSTKQSIHKGDKLQLKFNLDNSRKSFVDKEGIVKKIADNYVGVQFVDENWGEELKDYFPDE